MIPGENREGLLREHQAIFENAAIGILFSRGHRIERCNRRIAELFGYGPEELVGREAAIFYPCQDDYVRVRHAARADLFAGRPYATDVELRRKDGTAIHAHISARLVDEEATEPGVVWTLEDITERRCAELELDLARRELAQHLELARRVFENSSGSIMVTDADNRIVSVNRAFERMTGFAAAEVLGRDPGDLKSGRHDEAFYRAMWQSLGDKDHWQGEIWDRRKDGSVYPKLSTIDVVRDADGKIVNYVAVFSDISERKASEEEVHFLAHHDALTGLANRLALGLHLGHALAVARRNRTRVAVLFIDLDGFKPINDRYGHAAGDKLLVTLAGRLRQMARETDLVARMGGDEFVIVMEGSFTDEHLAEIGADLVAAVGEPCPMAVGEVVVSCSIGIACSPRDGDTAELLLAGADVAMYRAKAAGCGRHAFFVGDGSSRAREA